jgi:hypothetical protein
VRNGYHQPRTVTTAAGVVEVKAPRVNEKRVDEATGERKRFSSAILPAWCRKSPKISEVLPLLYLHGAKKAIQDIYNAEDRDQAEPAINTFAHLYGAKFPKAVKKIPEHWIHPRTTNPIESTFSTVRLRTKVTRGAGSRTAALAMVFKLVESAQQRWRAVNAPHLVALARSGARFERGQLIERPETRVA